MITCEQLTVEKVKAELETLEKAYKPEHRERLKKWRVAEHQFGSASPQAFDQWGAVRSLELIYRDYKKLLNALFAVLTVEQSPELRILLAVPKEEAFDGEPTGPAPN